jgi:hypothetical protein
LVKCSTEFHFSVLEDIVTDKEKQMGEILKKLQDNPRVKSIRVIVADDCCPTCAMYEGTYEKNEVVKLPIEGCSHQNGCRCFYEPMLNIIYP